MIKMFKYNEEYRDDFDWKMFGIILVVLVFGFLVSLLFNGERMVETFDKDSRVECTFENQERRWEYVDEDRLNL